MSDTDSVSDAGAGAGARTMVLDFDADTAVTPIGDHRFRSVLLDRWNIVSGDGLAVRLPLIVGFAHALDLLITGRRIDVHDAYRMGLVSEIVPEGKAYERALAITKMGLGSLDVLELELRTAETRLTLTSLP